MTKPSTGFERLLFIDTWGWLALEDAKDSAHSRVTVIRREYTDRGQVLVTSDYVLDETVARLFARRPFAEVETFCAGFFRAEKTGLLRVERITPARFERAYQLRLRYRDKPRISFTNLTSFVVMKELGIRLVLTADAHFTPVHLGFQVVP